MVLVKESIYFLGVDFSAASIIVVQGGAATRFSDDCRMVLRRTPPKEIDGVLNSPPRAAPITRYSSSKHWQTMRVPPESARPIDSRAPIIAAR